MEELKEQIMKAKAVQKELEELENKYSKYRSQKMLGRILELRDEYSLLLSIIHQQ